MSRQEIQDGSTPTLFEAAVLSSFMQERECSNATICPLGIHRSCANGFIFASRAYPIQGMWFGAARPPQRLTLLIFRPLSPQHIEAISNDQSQNQTKRNPHARVAKTGSDKEPETQPNGNAEARVAGYLFRWTGAVHSLFPYSVQIVGLGRILGFFVTDMPASIGYFGVDFWPSSRESLGRSGCQLTSGTVTKTRCGFSLIRSSTHWQGCPAWAKCPHLQTYRADRFHPQRHEPTPWGQAQPHEP